MFRLRGSLIDIGAGKLSTNNNNNNSSSVSTQQDHSESHLSDDERVRASLVSRHSARRALPVRPINGHKGTFGTVLIAAGSA
jgi:hypothetical protein